MAYTLEAVIGPPTVLSVVTQDQAGVVIVPLRKGLSLVSMTDELFHALTDGSPNQARSPTPKRNTSAE